MADALCTMGGRRKEGRELWLGLPSLRLSRVSGLEPPTWGNCGMSLTSGFYNSVILKEEASKEASKVQKNKEGVVHLLAHVSTFDW